MAMTNVALLFLRHFGLLHAYSCGLIFITGKIPCKISVFIVTSNDAKKLSMIALLNNYAIIHFLDNTEILKQMKI
jgi:hypothetical protein